MTDAWIVLLPFIWLLLLAAWVGCFWGAWKLVSQAKKHEPLTRIDRALPLRGRWLRYGVAALLVLLGVAIPFCVLYPVFAQARERAQRPLSTLPRTATASPHSTRVNPLGGDLVAVFG
jgi:hypothetical protein